MQLEIRLFAGLKCNNQELPCVGKDEFYLNVNDGMTVEDLRQLLQLKSQLPLIYLVNGLARAKDYVLVAKDRVGIFPPVGGG